MKSTSYAFVSLVWRLLYLRASRAQRKGRGMERTIQRYQVQVGDTDTGHKIFKVYTRSGHVYALHSAEPFPSVDDICSMWRTKRRVFRPFNETQNTYCD